MSSNIYYLVASLPLLLWGQKPLLSSEKFLEDCQRLLSPQDYEEIKRAVYEPHVVSSKNKALSLYQNFMHNFCNELASLRASKAHKNPLDHIREEKQTDPFSFDILMQAVKIEDPLEAERFVDHARWQFLDDLLSGHYFDLEVLIVYGIKLKILERYQEIESLKGKEIFEGYRKEVLKLTEI